MNCVGNSVNDPGQPNLDGSIQNPGPKSLHRGQLVNAVTRKKGWSVSTSKRKIFPYWQKAYLRSFCQIIQIKYCNPIHNTCETNECIIVGWDVTIMLALECLCQCLHHLHTGTSGKTQLFFKLVLVNSQSNQSKISYS